MKNLLFIGTVAVFSLVACQSQPSGSSNTADFMVGSQQKIGAYMIVRGESYDREKLAPYSAALPAIYEKYGGYYVGFAPKGTFEILEGTDPSDAILISAWSSVEAAQSFWNSPEYQEAIKLREGNGNFTVVIVPATPQQ